MKMPDHYVLPSMQYQSHKSLTFDGISDIMFCISGFVNTFPIQSTVPATVSLWVKNTGDGDVSVEQQTIMSRWFPFQGMAISEGGWRIYLQDTTFAATPNTTRAMVVHLSRHFLDGLWVHTAESFPLDEWVHVVMTYDGSRSWTGINVYWNGVAQTILRVFSSWSTASVPSNAYSHLIWGGQYTAWHPLGANPDWPPPIVWHFEGLMDETTLWYHELSATEVLELYHGGRPQNPLQVGRSNSKFTNGYFRMGDPSDGTPWVLGNSICWGRFRADAHFRNGFWNNDGLIPPARVSTDVPP